jgi:hypothetical protein
VGLRGLAQDLNRSGSLISRIPLAEQARNKALSILISGEYDAAFRHGMLLSSGRFVRSSHFQLYALF